MNVGALLNFFKPGQQQTVAPAVPGNPQLSTLPAAQPAAPANQAQPAAADPNAQATPAAPASPMDIFGKLWDTKPDAENTGIPKFSTDPAKLQEAASKINFAQAVDPALMQKAMGGDATAFQQVLNSVAQSVFTQAATVTTKLLDTGLDATSGHLAQQLPEHIRKHSTTNELVAENPMFAHPAVKPILDSLQSQLALTYPTATSSELAAKAKEYLTALMALNGTKPVAEAKPTTNGTQTDDWSTYGQPPAQ